MVNVNDTNSTHRKLERQWQMLYEADIDAGDRDAIEEYVRFHRKGMEDLAPTTRIRDLSVLRLSSSRSEVRLLEMDMKNLRTFIGVLARPESQGGYGVDPHDTGMEGYKQGLKDFFKWLDGENGYGDFGFYENIEPQSKPPERVSEEQTLDQEEIEALKAAAKYPRDRTLIEFLADTGARVSLASQLRVGDIYDLDTDRPYYKPNPNGENHKGAPNKRYPILYSQADLRSYINTYHVDARAESPLWATLTGYDPDNAEECALSGDRIRKILTECAERAGISKSVNPHNFRHTAITRLSKTGYTRKQIEHIAGWADDRMLDRYDHTTDQERNDQIRAQAGFIEETDTEIEPSRPKACGNCREMLGPSTRFCPNCGTATTEDARSALDEQETRFFDSATESQGELAEAVNDFRRLATEYPVLRAAMLDS